MRPENTTVQDTTPSADDNEVAAEGFLKMTSSGEVDEQTVTKCNVDDTGSHSGNSEANSK